MAGLPSIGWPELLVILAVALVIFGGSRLPEVGRDLGRAIQGFKGAVAEEPPDAGGAKPPADPESGAH